MFDLINPLGRKWGVPYDLNGPAFNDILCNLGAWQCIFQGQDVFLEGHDNALVYHLL